MEICVYLQGRDASTFGVVSEIALEVQTSTDVDTSTALLLAGSKVRNFLNAARAAKQAGAKLGYKMTMPHTILVEIDGEAIIDTADANRIMQGVDKLAFTFKAVTAGRAAANIAGAFGLWAEYASTEA